jgi:hypothetical protein
MTASLPDVETTQLSAVATDASPVWMAQLHQLTDHPMRTRAERRAQRVFRQYLARHETQEGQSLLHTAEVPWTRPVHRAAWLALQAKLRHLRQSCQRRHRRIWWGLTAGVPLGAGLLQGIMHGAFAPTFLGVELMALLGVPTVMGMAIGNSRSARLRQWTQPWCAHVDNLYLSPALLLDQAIAQLEEAIPSSEQQAAWEADQVTQPLWQRLQASDVPLLIKDVEELNRRLGSPELKSFTFSEPKQKTKVLEMEDLAEERWRGSRPTWFYLDEVDELSDQVTQRAFLESLHTITLPSPYDKPQVVTLEVAHHARHGWQVTVSLAKASGMFDHHREVTVRFDRAPMQQWRVKEYDHHQLRFQSPEAFVEALRNADRVRMEVVGYPQARHVVHFEADRRLDLTPVGPPVRPLPALESEISRENSWEWGDLDD